MGQLDESLLARRNGVRRNNRLALLSGTEAGSITVLCECGAACRKWLHLEADEYESASTRRRHVLAPGHQEADDRVVRERRSYVVVER